MSEHSSRPHLHRGAVVGVIAVTWLLVLPWMIPSTGADHGVFVSVAERLLAGDRLYVDVWDNKDPYFYFALAAGRSITPYGDIALEVLWMVLAGLSVTRIGRSLGVAPPASLIAGLALTPIALTGASYLPGHTHLPGIALTLAAFAAALSRRYALAGLTLGLLALTKLIMLPLGLALVALAIIRQRSVGVALRTTAGFLAGVGALLGVLALRGELLPYIESLRQNVLYSQGALVDYAASPLAGHLELVLNESGQVSLIAVATVLSAALIWPRAAAAVPDSSDRTTLWLATLLAAACGLAIIGATGLWFHHAQALSVAAALACLIAAAGVPFAPSRVPAALGVLAGVALLVSHPPNVWDWVRAVQGAPDRIASLATAPPEAEALLALGTSGAYARVGLGDPEGHAQGLRGWELACPRFHQYPFESAEVLDATLECLPSAQVLLISSSAAEFDGAPAPWNDFVNAVNNLVARDYSCEDAETARVCVRR